MRVLQAQNFFIYNARFDNVLRSTSPQRTITIQSNSDFEVMKLAAAIIYQTAAPDNLTTLAVPAVNVLITEAGTSEPWSDQPVPVYSLFGSGQLPFALPYTKVLKATRQLTIQVFNQFTATDIAFVELSFIGRRLYYKQGSSK